MNKQDLAKLGIEDEEIQKEILVLHGKGIEKLKTDIADAKTAYDELNVQFGEAGKTIESFKKLDVEGIQKAADEWKAKAEAAALEADQKVKTLKFDHALSESLKAAKAKNHKAVKALLEIDKLALAEDGESITGLDDQLKVVQTENTYLFDSQPESDGNDDDTSSDPKIVIGGEASKVVPDVIVSAARKGAKLARD